MLKAVPLMAVYDDFAWFYQRYWNEEFHGAAFPILEQLLLPRLPDRARILDVCCGSGYLAGLLAGRGYRVTGFDASPAMIDLARAHAPQARFEVADATSFRTRAKFDAAVCTFDSLNHILDPVDLTAAFRRIAAALKPGALFAFDILLEAAYRTDWAENFSLVRDDHVLVIAGTGFDFRTRLAHCNITTFRKTGEHWTRADIEIKERCYGVEEIDEALNQAGFGSTTCYDTQDLGMQGQLGTGRVFYITVAPAG